MHIMPDKFNPSYYVSPRGTTVVEIIEDFNLNFHLGSAISYIMRAGRKSGEPEQDDLKKAIWFLNRRITLLTEKQEEDEIYVSKQNMEKIKEQIIRHVPPCPNCQGHETKPLTMGKWVCTNCYIEFNPLKEKIHERSE